jgi:hypothetical protein
VFELLETLATLFEYAPLPVTVTSDAIAIGAIALSKTAPVAIAVVNLALNVIIFFLFTSSRLKRSPIKSVHFSRFWSLAQKKTETPLSNYLGLEKEASVFVILFCNKAFIIV